MARSARTRVRGEEDERMGVGDRTKKRPPHRRAALTEKLIQRIEKKNNGQHAFDPKALLHLLERDDEDDEDDEVSFRSDSSSCALKTKTSGGNDIISHGQGERIATSGGSSAKSDYASRYAPPSSVMSRHSNATMMTHINNNLNGITSSSGASVHSDNSSYFSTTSSVRSDSSSYSRTTALVGNIASAIAIAKHKWGNHRENINKWTAASAFLLLFSLFNMAMHRKSLGMYQDFTARAISSSEMTGLGGGGGGTDIPFVMCDRETPFRYSLNPATDRSNQQRPQIAFRHDWPKQNKILLLRNDGKFGNIGNQMNSLLHAFDYARDNNLQLGMLFHSWAMDLIQSMFYETDDFDALGVEMMKDLGILVVRNQTQLQYYDEVVSKNAQQLYFYKSSNKNMDHWKETMVVHKSIIQNLFFRYNRGYGYIHNGLRAQDVCGTLDMLFKGHVGDVKYSVIHYTFLDENAMWKLNKIAKASGLTVEGGVSSMGPAYVKSILKPLGMLDYPIILITDRQNTAAERGLLNDQTIGPKLMVLSERERMDGADVALALLSDVFIGNPASVTSGFISRSRMALGYSVETTQLFRRKR